MSAQTSVPSQALPHPFPTCTYTSALLEFLLQLPECTVLSPSGQECQCPTPATQVTPTHPWVQRALFQIKSSPPVMCLML